MMYLIDLPSLRSLNFVMHSGATATLVQVDFMSLWGQSQTTSWAPGVYEEQRGRVDSGIPGFTLETQVSTCSMVILCRCGQMDIP